MNKLVPGKLYRVRYQSYNSTTPEDALLYVVHPRAILSGADIDQVRCISLPMSRPVMFIEQEPVIPYLKVLFENKICWIPIMAQITLIEVDKNDDSR